MKISDRYSELLEKYEKFVEKNDNYIADAVCEWLEEEKNDRYWFAFMVWLEQNREEFGENQ